MNIVEPIKNIEDIKKIEEFLKKQYIRNYLLFKLGINWGLRISDILALNIKDVKNKDWIILKEKKTKKVKKIPISDNLKQMIIKYVKNKNSEQPLFTSRFNNRMDRTTAYRIIVQACKAVNIKARIGTHSLRKTFGYHFYKKYNNIALLQKILNHSSQDITLRYIGIDQDEIENAYLNFTI